MPSDRIFTLPQGRTEATPEWVSETPAECEYDLRMYSPSSGTALQDIFITREEFEGLKSILASRRKLETLHKPEDLAFRWAIPVEDIYDLFRKETGIVIVFPTKKTQRFDIRIPESVALRVYESFTIKAA